MGQLIQHLFIFTFVTIQKKVKEEATFGRNNKGDELIVDRDKIVVLCV